MPHFDIYSALVTPYTDSDRLDESALERLLAFQKAQGLAGVFVSGSSGESMLQTTEERVELLNAVSRLNPGLKLIAHVGSVSTRETEKLARVAGSARYDYVSAISPSYYKFSEDEIFNHYKRVTEASGLPLIVYTFPDKGLGLSYDLTLRLLDLPEVAGVKFTSLDLCMLDRIKQARPDKLVFNGFDEILVAGLSMGADGGIGTTYNFMGDAFVAISEAVARNDVQAARDLQSMVNRIIVKVYPSIIDGTKYVLQRMGCGAGNARSPYIPVDWAADKELGKLIDDLVAWREQRQAVTA